jgi:hypothetical protein
MPTKSGSSSETQRKVLILIRYNDDTEAKHITKGKTIPTALS